MECGRCKASNPDSNRYCGQCAAPLDPQMTPVLEFVRSSLRQEIEAALAKRFQDQKVVEVEITEKVVERLKGIGKTISIPLGLLAIVLSAWGIHSLSDVDVKIKKATDDAIANMTNTVNTATKKSLDDLKVKQDDLVQKEQKSAEETLHSAVDSAEKDLQSRAKSTMQDFDRLKREADNVHQQAQTLSREMQKIEPQLASFNQRLGNVESTVKALACGENAPRDVVECHEQFAAGCSATGTYDAYLNSLKNATPSPDSVPVSFLRLAEFVELDRKISFALETRNHEVHKGDLARLGEGQVVGLVGYVYSLQLAGIESANCLLTGEQNADFMLHLGFDKAATAMLHSDNPLPSDERRKIQQTSVVAEITPYYRYKFRPNWTLEKLRAIVGKQVKILGQLMMDSEHYKPAQDCGYPSANQRTCWRASAWEIHPVTAIYVCSSDTPCSLDDVHWSKVD